MLSQLHKYVTKKSFYLNHSQIIGWVLPSILIRDLFASSPVQSNLNSTFEKFPWLQKFGQFEMS